MKKEIRELSKAEMSKVYGGFSEWDCYKSGMGLVLGAGSFIVNPFPFLYNLGIAAVCAEV